MLEQDVIDEEDDDESSGVAEEDVCPLCRTRLICDDNGCYCPDAWCPWHMW